MLILDIFCLLKTCRKKGVADLDDELCFVSFEKANFKLIFGYVQNYHHSYLDSAMPCKSIANK